jgi:streptomycin 6-kinase
VTVILTQAASQVLLQHRRQANGSAGEAWVRRLPELVEAVAAAWSLALEPHFESLSYNFVAPVRCPDGSPAVLKLAFPDDPETRTEIETLSHFDGRGSVRLLKSDPEHGALLLQRLDPGLPVSSLHNDSAEVNATATVMRALWRPPPASASFPSMAAWIKGMVSKANAASRRIDWLDAAVALGRDLLARPASEPVVLHGDLHHENVISSGDAWLCIDPKGVIGEAAWEIGPFLYNNLGGEDGETSWRSIIRSRADHFASELDLDKSRVHACAAVYAALSASWALDDLSRRSTWLDQHRAVMQELGGF